MLAVENSYVTDGLCHNSELGTFGHECGMPAVWVGETGSGFRAGFCARCRAAGADAAHVVAWYPHPAAPWSAPDDALSDDTYCWTDRPHLPA